MSFIDTGSTTYGALSGSVYPKTIYASSPVPAVNKLSATDFNIACAALLDTRAWVRGDAKFYAFTEQASDPAPAGLGGVGQPGYIWSKTDHTVHIHLNGTDGPLGTATLPTSYAAGSAGPQIMALDSTRLGILARDASSPIGGTLFGIQNNAGSSKWLDVTASQVRTDGATGFLGAALDAVSGTLAVGATTATTITIGRTGQNVVMPGAASIGTATAPSAILQVAGASGIRFTTTAELDRPNEIKVDPLSPDGLYYTTRGNHTFIVDSDATGTNFFAVYKQNTSGTPKIYVDADNTRFGVNTATPGATIEAKGTTPDIFLNGSTSSLLRFATATLGAPAFTTRSAGQRIAIHDSTIDGTHSGVGFGVETGFVWSVIETNTAATQGFKWYGGTTEMLRLSCQGSTNAGAFVWPAVGVGAPTVTTRSAGTKLAYWSSLTGSLVDWAIGVETGFSWMSFESNTAGLGHKWYGGVTNILSLLTQGSTNAGVLVWPNVGTAAPSFTTRSVGTKVAIFNTLSGSAVDVALGVETGFFWFSTVDTTAGFKWYAGTTNVASLTGTASLTVGPIGSSSGSPEIFLNGATTNLIRLAAGGLSGPTASGARGAGEKICLYQIMPGGTEYALGVESARLWLGVDTTTSGFKFYGGTTSLLEIIGHGSTNAGHLLFPAAGQGAPAFTTRSVGTKLAVFNALGGAAVDYAIGYETDALWLSTSTTGKAIKFYGGTTLAAQLLGTSVFQPGTASTGTLGASATRWSAVWANTHNGAVQTISFSATPAFDAATGETLHLVLTNNVTSWTLAAGNAGQVVTIVWQQDGTGGRTVAGTPANVLLAGGAWTMTATASKTDSLTFRYDTVDSKWYEIGRSQNM